MNVKEIISRAKGEDLDFTRMSFDMPKDLNARFKAWCSENGVNKSSILRELIADLIGQEEGASGEVSS